MTDRYVSFGERIGIVPSLTLPLDSVSLSFRRAVWNFVRPRFTSHSGQPPDAWANAFWLRMAKDKRWDMDQHRNNNNDYCAHIIKEWLLDEQESRWDETYDFLEHFPRWANFNDTAVLRWESVVNRLSYEERSPYRFVNHRLAPLTSEQEQADVAEAAIHKGKYDISWAFE